MAPLNNPLERGEMYWKSTEKLPALSPMIVIWMDIKVKVKELNLSPDLDRHRMLEYCL